MLDLLEAWAGLDQPVGVMELVRITGMGKTTVTRLINALIQKRLVHRVPQTHTYVLGTKLLEWGTLTVWVRGFYESVRPYMALLSETLGETAHLGVLDDYDVVYVGQHQASGSVKPVVRVGSRVPSYCTAMGKVLIAHLPSDQQDDYLRNHPKRSHTNNTIIDSERLRIVIAEVQVSGYAFDDEEHRLGIRCVAAPIVNSMGKAVAALSVTAPSSRMKRDHKDRAIELVRHIAMQASQDLGWRAEGTWLPDSSRS